MKHLLLNLGLLSALLAGCYSSDQSLVASNSNLQQKPTSTYVADSSANTLNAVASTPVATASYFIDITTASGAKPCSGEVTLTIMSDFTISLPSATLQCLSLTIDIGSLLGSQLNQATGSKFDVNNLVSDGRILSTTQLGGASFAPARPFLIGPIVQDVSVFNGFSRVTATTVTVPSTTPNTPPLTAPGSFTTTVLETNATYTNDSINKTFDQILHWKLEASGFFGIPIQDGLLFRKWEWYWNVRPIMIAKIIITIDDIANFSAAPAANQAADLVGAVTVTLTVKSFNLNGAAGPPAQLK